MDKLIVALSADIKELKAKLGEAQGLLKNYGTNTEKAGDNAAKGFDAVSSSIKNLIGAYVGLQSAQALLVNSFNTSLKLDAIQNSFAAIFNSADEGERQFDRLKRKAEELGVSIVSLADSYKLFAGATQASGMSIEQTNKIFDSVAKTSAVLKLSSEETEGALRALAQMMGKGTVQAEELRGQLGERIPGAFKLAANAMGVTEQELGKMLEQGKIMASDLLPKLANELDKTFGYKVKGKVTGLASEWQRFKDNFTLAVEATRVGDAFNWVFKSINTKLNAFLFSLKSAGEKAEFKINFQLDSVKTQKELQALILDFTKTQKTLEYGSDVWRAYTNGIIEAGNRIDDFNAKKVDVKTPQKGQSLSSKMEFNLPTINPMADVDLTMLNAVEKELTDFQAQTNMLIGNFKELGIIGDEAFKTITNTTAPNEAITNLAENAQNLVNVLGSGLTSAFDAALFSGQNFGQVMIKALGDLIKKLIAAVATAALLTAILNTFTAGGATAVGGFSGILKSLTGFNVGGRLANSGGGLVPSVNNSSNLVSGELLVRGSNLVSVLNSTSQRSSRIR